ncbi:MAG: tetratricopeptide repeat protein [Elusimicrobia bacterium]|nr:tetratricopeptide repeat protein [Elusimicrobiota bacterium]
MGLARAHLMAGSPDLALVPLELLEKSKPEVQPAKRELLIARTLEKKGRVDDALRFYERAAAHASGAEAFFRQGLFLARLGRKEEAKKILEQVLSQAKSSGKIYRRLERDWIQRSKRVLAELRK